jgi:ATP/maltotriose-dependent transcriptional regulator MalT
VERAPEVDTEALLQEAQEAIRAGEWSAAKERYATAIARGAGGEALFGLGVAFQWLGEPEVAIGHWERAYADFRRRRDAQQAVLAAFYLCLGYRMILGNETASRGWCRRAASVVEDLGASELSGWVELARAYVANETGRPHEGEVHAREALALARTTGDSDLELCTRSELGAALVAMGRVEEGTAQLDEAMAAALAGEGEDLDTVVLISCRTVASCDRGGDVRRATQWVRAADEFNRRYGSPHLYTTCRTHLGSVLFATGKWAEAEHEFKVALEVGKSAEPALHAEALARLGQLWLAQGRTEEAARLLEGYSDHPNAACAVAAVQLARAEPGAAVSVLRRRLREVGEGSLEAAAVSELLVEAEIAQGAPDEARARAGRLAEFASRVDSQLMWAWAQRAVGRAIAAVGEPDAAARLEAALAAFIRLDMPFEAARTRMLLATTLAEDDGDSAIDEARAALVAFEELGAGPGADAAAALLRSLGVKAARSGPKGVGLLTKREVEVLKLLGEGLSNPAIAERLFISRKTVEHHVGNILSKLALGSRSQATAYAIRNLSSSSDSASK